MTKRTCVKCGQLHDIAYIYHKNFTKHLILLHKNKKGKRSDIYIPYEDNLNIEIILTKADVKRGIKSRDNSPTPRASMTVEDETSLFPSLINR